jgi:DNA-binding transcriptional ArsR family regulator
VSSTATALDQTLAAGRLFKVLGDPTRLALLRRLADGPAKVTELAEALGDPPQSRISNHLACLRWCELVTSEKVGRNVIYRLTDSRVLAVVDLACEVAAPHTERLATCTRIGPDWM